MGKKENLFKKYRVTIKEKKNILFTNNFRWNIETKISVNSCIIFHKIRTRLTDIGDFYKNTSV